MKTKLLLFNFYLLLTVGLQAQVPNAFSYQGVARNNTGQSLANQAISIRASILNTSATGTAVYEETHTATTNAFGLFTLSIGSGTATTGTFAAIDWAVNTKFLKIEMDATGGSNYTLAGTTQLLSVPYAQFAKNSTPQTISVTGNNLTISGGNTVALPVGGGGKTFVTISGNLTNAQAVAKLASEAGVNTQVISVLNCSALTSIDLSAYTNLYSLNVKGNTVLSSIILTSLQEVASDFILLDNPALTTLNFPALTYCGQGMDIENNNALSSINAPILKSSGGRLYFFQNAQLSTIALPTLDNSEVLDVQDSPALTTISVANYKTGKIFIQLCPLLTAVNIPIWTGDDFTVVYTGISAVTIPSVIKANVYIYMNSNLTAISMSKLNDATITISGSPQLTSVNLPLLVTANLSIGGNKISSISFPALTTINGSFSISEAMLTHISLPVLTNYTGNGSIIIGRALNTAAVNAILAKLVAITPTFTGVNINLFQSPYVTPTGQGVTDQNILISRGNVVSFN